MSGAEQPDQYDQGLLVWKLYIEAMQLEEEFSDSAAQDDDSVDFTKVTPETVFRDFKDEMVVRLP